MTLTRRTVAWIVAAVLVLALAGFLLLRPDSVTPEQQACAEQLHAKFPENSLGDWIETCQETHPG